MKMLKTLYEKYTPAIRTLFIGLTVLQLLWDIMLVCTMLYFHKMIEKVLSGVFAILTWYFCYRFWYPSSVLPDAAGRGMFVYQKLKNKATASIPLRRTSSLLQQQASRINDVPRFMGMPYGVNAQSGSGAGPSSSVSSSSNVETTRFQD